MKKKCLFPLIPIDTKEFLLNDISHKQVFHSSRNFTSGFELNFYKLPALLISFYNSLMLQKYLTFHWPKQLDLVADKKIGGTYQRYEKRQFYKQIIMFIVEIGIKKYEENMFK